jgi:hypothetical protein
MSWPNTKPGSTSFIEERYPQIFPSWKRPGNHRRSDKLMGEALTAYGDEFKDTIK